MEGEREFEGGFREGISWDSERGGFGCYWGGGVGYVSHVIAPYFNSCSWISEAEIDERGDESHGEEHYSRMLIGENIGNRVATIGKALGMTVLLLDRKTASQTENRPGRTPFLEGLANSTILILTCPLTPATTNLISTAELSILQPSCIIINVARGGIVDEAALVLALKEERVAGAAADVFVVEPATKENSPLVKAAGEEWARGKMVLSPHVAWCAKSSIDRLRGTVTANVEGWSKGEAVNVVV